MAYNWQLADWPEFKYNLKGLDDTLFAFADQTGQMNGILRGLPEELRMEAIIDIMVAEAIKTSEIEGEFLSRQDVMSSIRNNLGLNKKTEVIKDKGAQGAGELMVAVRNSFSAPLTESTLFDWHTMLMRYSTGITAGAWRNGEAPMQVVSGAFGREIVHFEAPPSATVPEEMKRFIEWFNNTAPGGKYEIKKAPIRSAIAHLYFETIHPFEDGNGRMGRAIAEKALSQTVGRPLLLSISKTIEAEKKDYYNALKDAQHGNEISNWINYFVRVILQAQEQALELANFILKKTRFFDNYKEINERQLKAVKKMLDAGPDGFEGGMTAKKYMSITHASKATATRDLQSLLEMGALAIEGGGRSTHYRLTI